MSVSNRLRKATLQPQQLRAMHAKMGKSNIRSFRDIKVPEYRLSDIKIPKRRFSHIHGFDTLFGIDSTLKEEVCR